MKHVTRTFRRIASAALLAGLCAGAAHGQDEPSSADTFNIPDNIEILGANDPNARRATAIVNGSIITGTDVEQRVALILDANKGVRVSEEELKRLRLQVLRNLR